MPTHERTIPTQNLFLCCNHCSRPFIHSQSVRGVVAQERDPSITYHVADHICSVFCRPDDEVITSQGIRAANQLGQSEMHPIDYILKHHQRRSGSG